MRMKSVAEPDRVRRRGIITRAYSSSTSLTCSLTHAAASGLTGIELLPSYTLCSVWIGARNLGRV